MDHWIADLTSELLWARDLSAVREAVRRFAAQAGVNHFAYGRYEAPGKPGYIDTTYPKAWIDHYFANAYYLFDPVVLEANVNRVPFAWRFVANRPSLEDRQRQLFADAASFGICDGLSIPIHNDSGCSGIMSFAFSSSERMREVTTAQPNLRLLGLYYHAAIERLLAEGETGHNGPQSSLSTLETQCLTWSASGRSLWEISATLHRAESEVARSLRSARQKLGAATIDQAVASALSRGLIHI